ncbi:TonB-dependent siderophore myxochelin receptor MxcH [Sorangium sp. So ce341]|uniref:TonB-dependent siderophore myxochelin receptor MxcH n=1 Tax=Sorangium sp. So ce341 TaxID=3133302 RepID=UPI003F624F6D
MDSGGWQPSSNMFIAVLLVLLVPREALGQAEPGAPQPVPEAPPSPVEARPPELLEQAEATYPEQAKAARIEASVVLRLLVDEAGNVAEAEVAQPAGHGLDEAAREAALRSRFRPAEREGQPTAARILFQYDFKLPPEEMPPPAPGAVRGTITAGGAAVDAAEVTLTGPEGLVAPPEGLVHRTTSGAGGAFRLEGLAPGKYAARVAQNGREATARIEVLPAGEVSIRLELPPPAPPAPEEPIEVVVTGSRTEAEQLQQSAEAVNVIDTRRAKELTADLGEVLARTQGVAVRRNGGLGSSTRFSLNGLYDDQIRFFLDGVPLDVAGYPFGIENVPVDLVDQVEVYRGVVPIRLGADALGGAVNLVSDQRYETHAGASFQVGSTGTYRVTADGRYHHEPTGLFLGAASFFDVTRNNYDVDVEVNDDSGRLYPATVPRFHDGYRAYGATFDAGVVGRPWARRLLLSGFYSTYDKELQHNTLMTVPYGEVTYGETVYGATARYEAELHPQIDLEVVGSYARRIVDYDDQSKWVYDWYGRRTHERPKRGEIEAGQPHDQTVWKDGAFGRGLVEWAIAPEHILRASFAPSFSTRTGDERIQADPSERDALTAQRDLFTLVSGLEYELNLFGERLSNIVFVKDYYYNAKIEERPAGSDIFRRRDAERHALGAGGALRFRFTPWLYAKASYEYATRLPRPDEVFGDGVLIRDNLELEPEVSHNANVGPRVELRRTRFGAFTLDINAFLRDSDRLIALFGNERSFTHYNVYKARGMGLESASSWVSPGRYVRLDGMLTWQDVRNDSDTGPFAPCKGDRIPNRPYLFGSWGARLRFAGMPSSLDTLEPFYGGRYVHEFFRGWECHGTPRYKLTVDAQVTQNAGISWVSSRPFARVTSTFEVDNIADAKVFDNFGVQRPGRVFYVKVTGEIR